jgi:hypothetical protein
MSTSLKKLTVPFVFVAFLAVGCSKSTPSTSSTPSGGGVGGGGGSTPGKTSKPVPPPPPIEKI